MKLGVSSRLQTYQILTNDVQVLILCLSYSITTVHSLPLTKTALFLLSSDFALNLEGSKSGKIPASRRFLDDG